MYCRTRDGLTPRYDAASSVVKYLLMRKEYTRCDRSTQARAFTGPPGAGRSQVAVALLASAALAGRSVLLASRNHQALDAVGERFAEAVERRPLLVRANPRDGGDGFSFERALDAILARPGRSGRNERFVASRAALERLDAVRAAAMDRAGRGGRAITMPCWRIKNARSQ